MKAAVVDRYGPPHVVRVAEVPTPTPGDAEILVRVAAAAVTAADSRIRAARFPSGYGPFARLMFGVFRPRRKILGSTFSGVVESVGVKVGGYSRGDEVCGMTGLAMGTHAEYVTVAAERVVRKPAAVSHTDAAALLFGGSTALHFLRDKAAAGRGGSVLVNGASGAVGTSAVQLAKHFGATVTAVTSTPNVGLVAGLGADTVVDYTVTPVSDLTDRFDVVLDTVGNLTPSSGRTLLTDGGVLLLAVANLWETLRPGADVKAGAAPERTEDFEFLLELSAAGRLVTVTDDIGGLEQIVSAHARVDSGHKVGNLVVRPAG